MKRTLRFLSVLTVSFLLSGCALATAVERLGFMSQSAFFEMKFAGADAYSYTMSTTVDARYRYLGYEQSESFSYDIESDVYLDDFLIDATVTSDGETTRILVFEEEDAKVAYQWVGEDVLYPIDGFTEDDLAALSGFEAGDRTAIGIDDFEGIVRNDDGTFGLSVDLGAEEGFGYEMATEIAAASGLEREDLADVAVDLLVDIDNREDTLSIAATLEDFEFMMQGIEFTFDIGVTTSLALRDVPARTEPEDPYYGLPTQTFGAAVDARPDETTRVFVAGGSGFHWLRIELEAGDYLIEWTGTDMALSIGVANSAGIYFHGGSPFFTAPADGTYYIGFDCGRTACRLEVTIVPQPNP
ncbi:MAG: hypothetical protein WC509_05055 [Candidatus Izemoplasmatales bacterium]